MKIAALTLQPVIHDFSGVFNTGLRLGSVLHSIARFEQKRLRSLGYLAILLQNIYQPMME